MTCRIRTGWVALVILFTVRPLFAANPVVQVGTYRFTVITPNLIRIEQSANRRFIDGRSMFAVNREARFADFATSQDGQTVAIDTGAIRLATDGNTVSAAIKRGQDWVPWKPGAANPGNLGGTIRTLDGVSGPVDLGQGVLSRDGWYLLDDSRGPLLTDDWVRSRPADAGTDWYLFGYGTDYRAALKSLTTIGGPVPMPRKYLLGAWYSRYWNYSADDFRNIVREYAEMDFPLDVMVMDMDWHITRLDGQTDGRQIWTGYTWDRKLIPDPEALLKWFHEQGLHVTLNDHPADGVQPHEAMYDAFMNEMGRDPASKETIPFDAGDKKFLDTFWKHTHAPLLQSGVDFWWLDWQQFPFTRSIGDLTNLAWLNHYYFNRTASPERRGTSFSRWAGWGDHRHPIHFSGDAHTGWPMLEFEVPFTSTAGNVGCFFWSHDIGGHMGGRNEESYARWCQFGATTAALRSHSTRDKEMDRRPWAYPKWAEDSMKVSFHLRSQLFPYIYSSARQTCRESVPLNRPMYFDYPELPQAYENPQQYLFGDSLLVAPIVSPGVGLGRVGRQIVWFAPGEWFNYFTGERYVGDGDQHLVAAGINEFPLYFRGGVPVPMQPYTPRMTTAPLSTLVVRCYPGADGQEGRSTLYEDDGVSNAYQRGEFATTELSYVRRGTQTTVTIEPAQGSFQGQLKQRQYLIELPGVVGATNLLLNGRPVPTVNDSTGRLLSVSVPAQEISQRVVLQLDSNLLDYAVLAQQTAAARAEISDSPEARLWSRGVGLVRSGAAVRFFAPRGVIDGDRFTWSIGEQRGDMEVTGRPFEIPRATGSAPVSLTRQAIVSLTVDGKPLSLSQSLPFDDVLTSELNLARHARATASSCENGYTAAGVIDGRVSGYPISKAAEWASDGELANAFVRLEWDTPQTISTIALFDRPNPTDQVLSGQITFSDGPPLEVGEVFNDALTPVELRFEPREVRWLQFTVQTVRPGTLNAGLSEIAVYGPPRP